ncbi:MAG: helix-turn-helix domain-containing protein [Actinobacteria bacterium]|nr:helix-turn-helix domain-containing protein [Actinomycetota bacterium]
MAKTTPLDMRATILAQLDDPRAGGLDIEAWVQILSRSGERIASASRTRLATSAGRARVADVPLTTVIDAWMAVGAATLATESRTPAGHLRLIADGTRALCAGYADGQAESIRQAERQRALLIEALLSDQPPEQVQELASRIGIELTGRRSVLLVSEVSEVVLDRLDDAGALAAPQRGRIVAIIGGRVPRGPETAGLGRPGLGIPGIRASYADAKRALNMARRLGLRGIVPYGDVLPEALIGQDQVTLRELVDATLTPLRSTRNGGPQYIETASVWLQEGLSVAATARVLDVHERTVRYRLARIAKLTSLDLQHADDRFRLELAVRGARLLGDVPTA